VTDKKGRRIEELEKEISRRQFLKFTGVVVAGAGAGVGISGCPAMTDDGGADGGAGSGGGVDGGAGVGGSAGIDGSVVAIPVSEGYLVVDTKKCQGCVSCMIACSLVHEGKASLSMSRIQILQNSFEKFPNDVSIEQCRQCVNPLCVTACPTGALHADEDNGNVRRVDREKCIGCGKCVAACPYTPSRPIVAPDAAFQDAEKSRKCDLCANAPYLCDAEGNDVAGGPGGMQACVAICPVGAIAFTSEVPEQEGDSGYDVNLRDEKWGELGYPTD
jgi:protein NrfC